MTFGLRLMRRTPSRRPRGPRTETDAAGVDEAVIAEPTIELVVGMTTDHDRLSDPREDLPQALVTCCGRDDFRVASWTNRLL